MASLLRDRLLPPAVRRLQQEIDERVSKLWLHVNEYGYDPYGLSIDSIRTMALPGALLYRHWFRCRTFGTESLPPGRMLLVANHAGQLPFDGAMLASALLLDAEPPRVARPMGEYFLPRLPFLGVAIARGGGMVGTPENCTHMLRNDECVMVFPEGVRGISKPYHLAYQLQDFGLGFMRLALETGAPIVPVGIVGSEEQAPALANLEGLGRQLGLPSLPITPTFPWLGPLGAIPLPTRYRIHFGEALSFEGDAGEEDAALRARVDVVKDAVAALLERGLAEREGVFT